MKTFNSNKELKQELIKKLQHHQDLDAFIQGAWLDTDSGESEGDVFKGCFYGCTMQTIEDPIEKFSKKYNIDLWYCYITEKIFEGLPKGEYEKFPLESIKVLPVGADLNKIKSLFHYRVLESQLEFCENDKKVTDSIRKCMELFKVPFDQIDKPEARLAAESAESAARSAAMSAAWSAVSAARSAASAKLAARAAAKLAARAAAWSAELAARSAASSTSEQDYYVFMKNTLFACIKETY